MAKNFVEESKIIPPLSDLISEPKRMLPPIKGYENLPIVSLEQAIKPLISFIPEVEHMVWTVKQNCEKPKDGLTSDESGSIMLYTLEWEPPELSFYFILNSILRSQNRQELRPWFLYLRLIIFALAKLPSIPSRTIFRGVRLDMSQEFLKDKTFVWWSFSSCTSTIDVIKHFLGERGPRTIINIESDTAKDISRHTFYQIENEILLYPARQFKVISSLDAGNELHIIHLNEIQPPFPLIHIQEIATSISPTIPVTPTNQSYQNQRLKDLIGKYQHHSAIELGSQKLTDRDMNIVVKEAVTNKQCKELGLGSNKISSAAVSIIAKILDGNITLESLRLSYNHGVGDTGIHFLAQTLSLNRSSLSSLFLDQTGITDKGAEYLGEMLKKNSTLRFLTLRINNIGDRGVELLTSALSHHNSTLQSINLSWNKLVSDRSVDFLVEMFDQNHSLSDLIISNCNLTEQGKGRLQQITQIKKNVLLFV